MKLLNRENLISLLVVGIFVLLLSDRFFPETVRVKQPPARTPPRAAQAPPSEPNRDAVLTFILQHEGRGFTKEVKGYSVSGITEASWTQWRSQQGDRNDLPTDVRQASDTQVKRFYTDYFEDFHVWEVHFSLQLIFADFAVQSGHQAVKTLQDIIGTHADGVWGSRTTQKVSAFNISLTDKEKQLRAFEDYDTRKRDFFRWLAKHPDHKDDLKGWLKRSDDLKAYMQQYFQ